MPSKNRTLIPALTAALAVCLLSPATAPAQIIYGQPAAGEIGVVYTHWKLESADTTTEINQLTVPLTGYVPIRDNCEAYVFLRSSSNSLTRAQTDFDLSGLSDIRLQVNRSFREDQVLLSVGLNLPTGKKELTQDEELPVLQQLSRNYLSFPMRRFGEGFGFNILLGGAQRVGELRLGGGAMYQFNGKYKPYRDTDEYDHGDFISINAGADWPRDPWTFNADAVFTHYFDDKVDGEKIFKQSTQFDIRVGAEYRSDVYEFTAGLGYLARGRNTFYRPGQNIEERIFGNEFSLTGSFTRHFNQSWYLQPTAELRLIAENEQGFGSSNILGIGAVLGKTLGERTSVNLGGRFYTGGADDGNIDLNGFQVVAGLAVSL